MCDSGYHDGRFPNGTEISPGQTFHQPGCSIEYHYIAGSCYSWVRIDACGWHVKSECASITILETRKTNRATLQQEYQLPPALLGHICVKHHSLSIIWILNVSNTRLTIAVRPGINVVDFSRAGFWILDLMSYGA
jgi:hypothetical protein